MRHNGGPCKGGAFDAEEDGYCLLCRLRDVLTNERSVGGGQLGKAMPLQAMRKASWWLRNTPCCTMLRMQKCAWHHRLRKNKGKT